MRIGPGACSGNSIRLRAGVLTLAILAFALSACASAPRLGGDPDLRVVAASELPVPLGDEAARRLMPYRIAPSDKLIIDVFGFEDLANREILVDSAGRISVPLAGSLDAAGLSPADLEAALVARLRQAHVRDPKVSVNVKEATSQTIAIDGQVRKPGIYPAAGVSTLMRAVARAEGTDEFSRLEEVVVFRTVAGQRYAALYNLDAIRHGTYSDPELYANDLVMVGENRSRRLFADLLTVTSALSTPLIIALDRLGN